MSKTFMNLAGKLMPLVKASVETPQRKVTHTIPYSFNDRQ